MGREDRKFWEIAMVVSAVDRHIPPEKRRMALGVGSGTEGTSFILTNYFDLVYATDLYGTGGWLGDAPLEMLVTPEHFAGSIPWKPKRLIVGHMDARSLRVESNSVDLVYSCSSIEHFGTLSQIAYSAEEMGRVLRKGGIVAISTELSLTGRRGQLGRDTILLTEDDIDRYIVGPSGCRRVDLPDYSSSEANTAAPVSFKTAVCEQQFMQNRLQFRWSTYPHIVIQHEASVWTSAQITLVKD